MDTSKVISDVQATSEKLVATLSGFDRQDFNTSTAADAWSAGDIAEHLYILDKRINWVLKEPAAASERPFDQKVPMIEAALLNRAQKFAVPDIIRPSTGDKDQQDIIQKLQQQRQAQEEIIRTTDLTETVSTNHIRLGSLTRLEWIYFGIYHTQRHIEQLENLKAVIDALEANS